MQKSIRSLLILSFSFLLITPFLINGTEPFLDLTKDKENKTVTEESREKQRKENLEIESRHKEFLKSKNLKQDEPLDVQKAIYKEHIKNKELEQDNINSDDDKEKTILEKVEEDVQKDKEIDFEEEEEEEEEAKFEPGLDSSDMLIHNIIVIGNNLVGDKAILNIIPYKVGDYFDQIKSNQLILRLYRIGFFSEIELKAKKFDDESIDLIIVVKEKKNLKNVVIKGNENLKRSDIFKEIPFDEIHSIDKPEMKKYAEMIKKIYIKKD